MNNLGISRAYLGGILFLGLLAMTARTATDPDLWWHLRTGKWIVETGHIPRVDPFSFTRGGEAWISHEWLSEAIFYRLWQLGGFPGLIVFSAIVTATGFLLLYLRCPGKPVWAAAATVLGALAAAPCWGVRPQMFTFSLASLLLWLVEAGERRPRILLWIPPLFLLWLNLHAGFALGPALIVLYACGLTLEALTGTALRRDVAPTIIRLLLTTLACLALVPLNPNGVHLYRYPFDTLRSAGMRSFIVEWFSPDFHQRLYTPFLVLLLVVLTVLALSRNTIRGRILLPLLFTLLAALDAVRHIPIFVLFAIPTLAASLDGWDRVTLDISKRYRPQGRVPRFRVAVLVLLAIFAAERWVTLSRDQSRREASDYPLSAVTFLRAHPQPSRMFAYYDWGGYLIWNLYPQYLVFVDGRADLYGDHLLGDFEDAVQVRREWRDVLARWDVETVLIPPTSALAQALTLDSSWSVPYRDSRAIIFQRATATTAQQVVRSPKGP